MLSSIFYVVVIGYRGVTAYPDSRFHLTSGIELFYFDGRNSISCFVHTSYSCNIELSVRYRNLYSLNSIVSGKIDHLRHTLDIDRRSRAVTGHYGYLIKTFRKVNIELSSGKLYCVSSSALTLSTYVGYASGEAVSSAGVVSVGSTYACKASGCTRTAQIEFPVSLCC